MYFNYEGYIYELFKRTQHIKFLISISHNQQKINFYKKLLNCTINRIAAINTLNCRNVRENNTDNLKKFTLKDLEQYDGSLGKPAYSSKNNCCPNIIAKHSTAKSLISMAINSKLKEKINLIWLEAAGCSGNIISLLNADDPDIVYFIDKMVDFRFNNSLMGAEGEFAFEQFLNTLDTDFILVIEGAISTKNNGYYNIFAEYNDKAVTALQAALMAAEKAKYILAVGTCASFGGISAAAPNPAQCKSVHEILNKKVINLPGCPCNPSWVIGTIAHIIVSGYPELDEKGRPLLFYSTTVHDNCPRRSYFDKGIFAEKLGDKECMFKLGCRGPVTKAPCPITLWNDKINWPIGDNTPCIGCTTEKFPDGMEPFIRY